MARGTSKKKSASASAATGPLTHDNTKNELSDDQRLALTLQHKKLIVAATTAKKKADAEFKNAFKVAKADLGNDGIADIKDAIAADNDEHFEEKLQADLERIARLSRWLGFDIGTQGSLFGTTAPSQEEKGYAEGKRAGIANEVCKPPYGAGTDGYDGYMRGWHDGAAVRTNMRSEQQEGESILLRKPENELAGQDDFDKAADGGATKEPWPDDQKLGDRKSETEPA